jgi:hypothetical protein
VNCWIFKVSEAGTYPDVRGKSYVFDNRHSVRVKRGDEFLYLEKSQRMYAFTGAGRVERVAARSATGEEHRSQRVTRIFTASLGNVIWFQEPFDISRQRKSGKANRLLLGLPDDVNVVGWSRSMPRIDRDLYVRLLDVAFVGDRQRSYQGEPASSDGEIWRIEDSWSIVKIRHSLSVFRRTVLERHKYTCVICGTRLRVVLEVAHIRSYASCVEHRANPANGLCLCGFCHHAFDSGEIVLFSSGNVEIVEHETDEIARVHFTAVIPEIRRRWLQGVSVELLEERAQVAKNAWSK